MITGDQSDPPASRTVTECRGSSDRRAATTQPALPAPITMKSDSVMDELTLFSKSELSTKTRREVRCITVNIDWLEVYVGVAV